jgi:hypothetical protein
MQTRFVEIMAVTVAFVGYSCSFPTSSSPTCDDDETLCPRSSAGATSVACDCHCTIGGGDNPVNNFDGTASFCLPPALNAMTSVGAQRVALASMDPRTFDQRVFGYCSQTVAAFVRLAIKAHADLKLAACLMPVECDCKTAGTERDSPTCHATCNPLPCTADNCDSVLRVDSKLDIAACACSRVTVCGVTQPPPAEPDLCRD